ncbi:DUF1622 domain-containing protein [Streptomyces sp. S3(2020)]|uniref:DUF1622 domain-containing protein n=1 Tax=Streptomyces sp. S3(2020) TaxID=2732044 RepID=UPI00148988D1|nr:DUF1622 domain-containing protein [Streptomyces sp. S3(2020)]
MTGLMTQAAVLTTAFGLVSAVCVSLRRRRVQPGVAVLTDFLVAAGLIRLAGQPSWASLATAAAVIGVRILVNAGLRTGPNRQQVRPGSP